jgi:hypothetical protein
LDDLIEYINSNLMFLIPVLWIIGYFLKKTTKIKNNLIPWILLIFAEISIILIQGFKYQDVLQGILITGAAVLGHQLLNQSKKK